MDEPRSRHDDDDDDRPERRQRGPRRDAHETQQSTAVQMALGGTATGLGVVALIFSFIPCCGMPFALGFGGLGLTCGGIGVIVALVAERRGLVFPCVGTGICVLAMLITVAWYFLFASMATTASNQAAANMQKVAKQIDEQNRKQIEENQKRQEEAMKNPKKDVGNPPGPIERTTTLNNLAEIGKAFHLYNDSKNFPMSSVNGQGKLSWRVAILPYIQQQALFGKFKLDEAWDSAHNRNVLNTFPMPRMFEAARTKPGDDANKTYYRLFTGPGTCYPTPNAKPQIGMINAGTSNTWLVAEGEKSVEWTKPDELVVKGSKMPALGGVFGGGFYVMCADGKAHYVNRDQFSPQVMLQLINPNRAQPVDGWPPN